MKIGIDASRYGHSEATGVESYSRHIINNLLRLLVKTDDEVILYSREKLNLDSVSGLGGKIINKVLSGKRLWTLKSLTREMRCNVPDVLFVPSHVLPLMFAKKSVITIHDAAFRHLKNAYSFTQYHYLNWSTKFAVKKATKIIVPSDATRQDLIHFFRCDPKKIVVVPHGFEKPSEVDYDKIMAESVVFKYFGIKKSTPYILFVGRLESKKNLVRLVEAFSKFSRQHRDYRLILAGKRGFGFKNILKKTNELGLIHKVAMPGYITEEEKAAFYKYASAFAFPSLYEGFGFPLLEAFYYRKPVLCSNLSALSEVGAEAVHYVDPLNVDKIAEGLELIISDEKYTADLVAAGTERLKIFSWEKAAKKTLKVLING